MVTTLADARFAFIDQLLSEDLIESQTMWEQAEEALVSRFGKYCLYFKLLYYAYSSAPILHIINPSLVCLPKQTIAPHAKKSAAKQDDRYAFLFKGQKTNSDSVKRTSSEDVLKVTDVNISFIYKFF